MVTVAKKPEKRAEPVMVSVESGRVTATLESIGQTFDAQNLGWHHRWVYDPPNNIVASNATGRQMEGYRFVDPEEITGFDISYHIEEGSNRIRVGDVILMKIESQRRQELLDYYQKKADSQMGRAEKGFHDEVKGAVAKSRSGRTHVAKPIGEISTEIEDRDVDLPKSGSE